MWLLPVLAGACLFVLNLEVPLFADDYCRQGAAFDPSHAARAAYKDYLRWTGRFPVMFLNRLFFSGGTMGILVLNLLNSIVLLLLAKLVMLHTRTENNPWSFAVAFSAFLFLLWFSTDVFGEVVFWKSGQIQYFWGVVIALACITPVIRLAVWEGAFRPSRSMMSLYLAGCLLGGMWLEHLSVAVAAVWSALLAYMWFFGRREVSRAVWVGLLLWLLGSIILIAAPGNYARAEILGERFGLLDKILPINERFFDQLDKKLLIVYAFFVSYCAAARSEDVLRKFAQSMLFLSVAYVSALATAGAPNLMYSGRIAFPSEFFLVCSVVSVYPAVVSSGSRVPGGGYIGLQRVPLLLLGVLCMLLTTIDAKNVYQGYKAIGVQEDQRGVLIDVAKSIAVSPVEIPPLYFDKHTHTGEGEVNEGRLFARDITTDPGRWENGCFARAHGIDKVRLK